MKRLFRLATLAVLLVVLVTLLAAGPATAQQWDRTAIRRALQATVEILVPDNDGELYGTGSGTVLDADRGIILTNYHVMGDPEQRALFNDEGLAYVAVNPVDLKGAPVLKYVAEMVEGSPDHDLAVLRIIGMADDPRARLPRNLGLVEVERGDSEELLPGDPLAVIGFPGLGGSTVTFTDGVVSGFLDENNDGVYEWIKTDTEVNPGNSGGLAIDTTGEFIGVPTAGYSRSDVAGKISLIRPGAIALEFFDRAVLGQNGSRPGAKESSTPPGSTTGLTPPSGAGFGAITFAKEVSDDNQPVEAGNAFIDVGTVYAFFAVDGVATGTPWSTRWLLDGEEVLGEEMSWEGSAGSTWVNITHPDGLPEGTYTLELYVDGELAQRGSFTVAAGGDIADGAAPVNVTGIMHDADNARRTISGAQIVVLMPGVTVDEWVDAEFDPSMIFASGVSVRGGSFRLDNKLTPGERYGVVVVHDDYKPIRVDDFEVPVDAEDPYELDVALERS